MPADRAPARKAILGGAWLGILTYVIPPGLAGEATAGIAGAAAGLPREKRPRQRMLTPRVTLYFVLGLCLFSGTAYAGVFLQVTAGLGVLAPATAALSAARARLGSEPVKALFGMLCTDLTPRAEDWSHVCGLLAVAWDGTGLTLADTEANAAVFGRPGAGGPKKGREKGPPPAPAARVVMLIACGTRAVLGAAAGPFRGKETGERELARKLLGCLHAGMLLLADKGFYSYQLWNEAAATGADLLWRARDSMHLPVIRELPDGSFLAHVNNPRAVHNRLHKNDKRRRRGSALPPDTSPIAGMTVRVIEFTLTVTQDDGTTRTSRYRLLTTLLDHRACPAPVLAAAYARRWASETGWAEVKTCLRGTGRALRGKTPDLAYQEIWALLAVYQAIRTLITLAAARDGLDPARVSFTTALQAIRRTTSAGRSQLTAARAAAETEILAVLVPERPHRTCPRAVKRVPYAPWPVRKPGQAPVSHHATCTVTITPPGQTTQNHPDQHQQPPTSDTTPP
jgi:hypothetical protein